MPQQPVHFSFEGELQQAQAEIAARRRLRSLEGAFPAVRRWEVSARSHPVSDAGGNPAEAHVAAVIFGGDRFESSGCASDALGALRLAFNALEKQLYDESENARDRAFHWFQKVRSRAPQGWLSAG